jgi:hypothetical protein
MQKIKTRAAFKTAILSNLGEPSIKVNVTDQQLDKAINQALRFFWKYHTQGSFESYYIYTVTEQDVTNKFIPIPERIDAVVEVLAKGLALTDLSFMTAEYQMTRDAFLGAQGFNNISLVDYVTLKARLYNTQQVLKTPKNFEFVKYQRRLIPQFGLKAEDKIVMFCYENVDPEDDSQPGYVDGGELFNDEVMLELGTAYTQQIWGNIMKKFGNVILPGGVSLNGEKLFDDAKADIERIKHELLDSNPIDFFMG